MCLLFKSEKYKIWCPAVLFLREFTGPKFLHESANGLTGTTFIKVFKKMKTNVGLHLTS
jgi:hypothetical protein